MTKSIEQSVKEKVRQIAASQSRHFNDVWLQVIMERWLSRLAQSPYSENLIFKGGMCLDRYLQIGRETKDLDFLVKGVITKREKLQIAFTEIANIDLNDGFKFDSIKLSPLAHAHKQYPGFELSMYAHLGMTRTHLKIDLGIGDNVIPENLTIILSQNKSIPLFEKEIALWAYSPEQIFAEKYETAIARGAANSRMKDYHDLAMLIQSGILDDDKLQTALVTTFKTRKTKYSLIPDFNKSSLEKIENYWTAHLRSVASTQVRELLPKSFIEARNLINSWMKQFNI